jgi:hypothetical protein
MVARAIAPHLSPRAAVLHCAGARGTDELRACEGRLSPSMGRGAPSRRAGESLKPVALA